VNAPVRDVVPQGVTVTKASRQTAHPVEVVAHDPQWAWAYARERELVASETGSSFISFEHIGSTAVPGLRAKPIIDMMAAVFTLEEVDALFPTLHKLGYELIETGMRNRHFLRKQDVHRRQVFHLHIVEQSSWDERNERLLRDYLLDHPEAVRAYGELKDTLAKAHAHDSLAYTKAKTKFIQDVVDKARLRRSLPLVDVWED
jgi:GrpB-like predicted nucleotidyltransferase (UPF0157 family)